MTLLVPFDGSDLAVAALDRAAQFAPVVDEPVTAITVVPDGSTEYGRERGWLEGEERFDLETVTSRLREQVAAVAPSATYRYETVGRYASAGTISSRVRKVATDVDASILFVGSENAGHMVVSVSSVGGSLAAEDTYDVLIVRQSRPEALARLPDSGGRGTTER